MNELFNKLTRQKQKKIICIGKNYLKHVKEMGGEAFPSEPVIFSKPWSALVYEPNPILIKEESSIEHEVELCVEIGKVASSVSSRNYLEYISNYFVGLDLTDRKMQAIGKKDNTGWYYGKEQEYQMPVSKFIRRDLVSDPHNLDIELRINGQVKQKDNTSSMHFTIGDIIEYVSKYITFYPGDLIMTGTPSGVGPIKVGDSIEAFISENNKTIVDMKFKVDRLI